MRRSPLLPIFLIVLVDVLGFTIVIPLLGFYAEKFGASPLVATTVVSVYAVCSLISTPIIGRLSDRYGRRRLLLISQAGTCAGFIMLAYSSALWMVFLGRILDGITAGNLSLAQAYISDHTAPENRAKSFGVIGVAFGIGFMFGPGIGGVLANYGMHVPFVVAACLSALSILATYTLLQRETPASPDSGSGPLPAGRRPSAFDIATYTEYFRRPNLGRLYAQFFCFAFAFSCFTSGFALFAERRFFAEHSVKRVGCALVVDDKLELPGATFGTIKVGDRTLRYGRDWTLFGDTIVPLDARVCPDLVLAARPTAHMPWTAHEVGFLFMFSGFLGILLQGGMIGRLVKRFGEPKLVVAGFIAAAVSYLLLGFTYTITMIVLVAIISAFGTGVLRPVITSRITQIAGRHEQGVALGISGSLSSFAMMLAPPTGGALINHSWLLAWACVPAAVSVLGLFLALLPQGANRAGTAAVPELSSAP